MTGDVENSPDPLGVQYVGPVGGDMHQVTVNGQTSYVPTSTVTSIPALAQGMTDRLAAAQAQSVSGVPSGVVPKPLAANPQPAGDYWSDPSRYNAAPAPVGAGNDNLNAPAPVPNLGKTAPVTQPNAAPVEPGGPPREQQTGPVATPTPTAATPTRAGAGGGDRTPSWIKSALGQEKDEASDALAASNTEYGLTKDLSAGRAKALQDEQADLAANETGRLADEQDAQRGAQDALDRAKQVADKWTNAKIDPENYWHSKDTAHQILAGLGMLVSGFGAGLAHQDNLAIKGMEDAQNRDLEAQKYNINHGKEASDVYRSIFQDYQAAGLSKDHAHQAAALTIKEKSLAAQDLDVAQHGGQVALLKFQQETAGQRKSLADQQLELGKTVDQHLQSQAATSNLRANTAHTYAETAQLGKRTWPRGSSSRSFRQTRSKR